MFRNLLAQAEVNASEELKVAKNFFTDLCEKLSDKVPALIVTLITFIVGIGVSKLILVAVEKGMKRSNLDRTAHGFLISLIRIVLYTIVIVISLTIFGVPMTSIIAVIGAAGLAVGLALQNSLSNLAGGFIILFAKPFKAGDFIETDGISGTVEHISILYTTIVLPDNRTAHIPNGTVSGARITNYTEKPTRRLDIVLSISYAADFDKVKKLVTEIVDKHEYALKTPKPEIRIGRYDESSVAVFVRIWTLSENYWGLNFDMMEKIKECFDKEGIEIPFNQLDVNLKKDI